METSTTFEATLAAIKPKKEYKIFDLVKSADISVRPWSLKKDGTKTLKPRQNTWQNMKWMFGGNDEPLAFTVWHQALSIDRVRQHIVWLDNIKSFTKEMLAERDGETQSQSANKRLALKLTRANEFDKGLQNAFDLGAPVRVILVAGTSTTAAEEAQASSKVKGRDLDIAFWYVHAYDRSTGDFRMVRGVELETAAPPVFNERLLLREDSELSDSERQAVTKVRIGQQYFRNTLLARWEEQCAVTGCGDPNMLIASHVVPWRLCESRKDRLIAANGLLLTPNLDRLFDQGLISFDENFRILISPALKESTRIHLTIHSEMRLRKGFEDMKPYLARHRSEIFKKSA